MLCAWFLLGAATCLAGDGETARGADSQAIDIAMDGFFRRPVGPRGLEPSDSLLHADGQRVRLRGYMVAREQPTPGRFLLTPRPVRLSEHADGEADDLPPAAVTVLLDADQAQRVVIQRSGVVVLTGRLQVGRLEDAGGRVSWVRLLLDREALAPDRSPPLSAATNFSH